MKDDIRVVTDYEELSNAAAEEFLVIANEAIQAKGIFTVALSGGSTPRRFYMLLASEPYGKKLSWSDIHLFWTDERCVPPEHPESNYRMVRETLLDRVPIPVENIHRMPTEQNDQDIAAAMYEQTLRAFFKVAPGEFPRFDLVLLGMGDDGHIASLFPGTAALNETKRFVVANYVDKLQSHRLTLTIPVINNAAHVIFLISGELKAPALKEVIEGSCKQQVVPAQLIQPINGRLLFIIDQKASIKLKISRGKQ